MRKKWPKDDELASASQELAGHHYEAAIRDICDAKLKGKQITSEQANSRFGAIQNYLRAQETYLFRWKFKETKPIRILLFKKLHLLVD